MRNIIELVDDEFDVADDLRRAAEYGTEYDEILEQVADKIDAAKAVAYA